MKKIYEYKRVNFLNAFREMKFEFLEDKPSLLVEKIFSVDKDWIGNANYEMYGETASGKYIQSESSNVPCIEGEWVVVCYSKLRKSIDEDNKILYGNEWKKYYLCQIDFSKEYLFEIVKSFDHIYDAFQYLATNNLVEIVKSDEKFKKQMSVQKADIVLEVLNGFEDKKDEFDYEELLEFFTKHVEKSNEINDYLKSREISINSIKSIHVRRFFPIEPFTQDKQKLTIGEYLELVKEYRYNYIWNI